MSVFGILAIRRVIIADPENGGPDRVMDGLSVLLPAYACCALGSLGTWLICAAWQ
ncbi:hypothetical protein RcapNL_00040 [Rhodobacter phage RcapNL]|uniref:Uncharacterized protein n=1 Tax=Rhodobacter phage RcapNL TaxID=1131316 RepID=H6WBP3_9CAUD|nr:hypothetical protein I920_gp40 [Rhodobacter phage RcapNL]AFA44880.1 hypothetical protein RcapNL_00040 [Rhodobacter phage RcapNL]